LCNFDLTWMSQSFAMTEYGADGVEHSSHSRLAFFAWRLVH
jgi:hypothetical protein